MTKKTDIKLGRKKLLKFFGSEEYLRLTAWHWKVSSRGKEWITMIDEDMGETHHVGPLNIKRVASLAGMRKREVKDVLDAMAETIDVGAYSGNIH